MPSTHSVPFDSAAHTIRSGLVLAALLAFAPMGWAAPLYESCAAEISRPVASAVDRTSEDAVALAFMQAMAHKDLDTARQLTADMLEEEPGTYAYLMKRLVQLVDKVGGVHAIELGKKEKRTEVYMPHVVGVELLFAAIDIRLTFCVKDESSKGHQIKPAKVPIRLVLALVNGAWGVVNMRPAYEEPYDKPADKAEN
ncbi:hypothetical protein [Ottowia sp.]|uniref:hypothetical protein n=1 Tax=Ottowia sp. TaxID=1898956 RepID=UPI003A83A912